MRLSFVVLGGAVLLLGCKADIDLEAKRQYACSLDGGAVVKSGLADPQCPSGMRCGLEGFCHEPKPSAYLCSAFDGGYSDDYCEEGWRCGLSGVCHARIGAPYECNGPQGPSDVWCEAGWRCGPDGKCVSTELDALVARTGADVTSSPLYPLGGLPNADAFGATPFVVRAASCGLTYGRSATVVSGTTVHRMATALALPQPDGGFCDPPPEALATTFSLNATNFTVSAVADVGTLALIAGTSGSTDMLCPSAWYVGLPVADAGCTPVPHRIEGISASPGELVQINLGGGENRMLSIGSRYLAWNGAWQIAAGSSLIGRPTNLYEDNTSASLRPPGAQPLVDLTLFSDPVQQPDAGIVSLVVAIDDAGMLFASELRDDLRLVSPVFPAGASPFEPLNARLSTSQSECFIDPLQRPKMLRYHQGRSGNGNTQLFVAFDRPFTPGPGHEAVIQVIEFTPTGNPPDRACVPPSSPGPIQIGGKRLFLSQNVYRLCRGAELLDFVAETNDDGRWGVRAWCRADATGKLQYEVLTGPSNDGASEEISTTRGEYVVPAVPYFQRPLKFSHRHAGVWAQLDDEGRIWTSVEEGADDTPAPLLEALLPDRPPSALLGAITRPLMFSEGLSFGPIQIAGAQGWAPVSSGAWEVLALSGGGIIPVAPVGNQPTWAVTRSNDSKIPTPIFVFDFASLVEGSISEKGVRVPARIGDPSLLRPPYTSLHAKAYDGSELLVLTVDDTLATVDITNVVNDPDAGFVTSPSQIVSIPAADARLTPVSRGSITSLTASPNDGTNFFAGYLLAGGRVFRYTAPNPNVWRSSELEVGTGQPVAVLSQNDRIRVVYRDGAVLGLPSRTALSAVLSAADAGTVSQSVSGCGELLAVTEKGLFFLATTAASDGGTALGGRWQRVDTQARFAAAPKPSLHVIKGGVVLVDSDGAIHRIVTPGACP